MAIFQTIWAQRSSIIEEYQKLKCEAEENEFAEKESAVKIQRLYRGQRIRSHVTTMKAGEILIARVFRGYMGRARASSLKSELDTQREIAIFQYHAALIQRTFRGFYSRRYYHDFSARKKYITDIIEKGQSLRQKMHQNLCKQQEEEWERTQQQTAAELEKVTQNLHHLVSTNAQRGVFNSPYDEMPTVNGRPVEEHLRAGVKDLLRSRTIDAKLKTKHSKKMTTNLNGTKLVPVRPPASRLTLQASTNYNVLKEQEAMDKKLNKMQWIGDKKGFIAGQKVQENSYERGVSKGSAYVDPWKNPYRKRGIPKNMDDLQGVRTSLEQYPEVPFYTRVGGNKSTVHPNDTFDVIHEAEFTGGAIGRHKGRTLRFGVPDTADVRETSQLYMCPPYPPFRRNVLQSLTN